MSIRTKSLGILCAGCVAVGGIVLDARTAKELKPIDAGLAEVAYCAYQKERFIVYHGHRTDAEQADFISRGVSWVRRSKHQDGLAIDVMALDAKGKGTWELKYYTPIAKAFYECGRKHNVQIVWGCEWKVKDCVHFERK